MSNYNKGQQQKTMAPSGEKGNIFVHLESIKVYINIPIKQYKNIHFFLRMSIKTVAQYNKRVRCIVFLMSPIFAQVLH